MDVRARYTEIPKDSSPKDEIVSILYESGGATVSGQRLARILGISRPGVWKHVQSLKKHGVPIQAVKNEGYRLADGTDLIIPSIVQKSLRTKSLGRVIMYAPETGSTNSDAKELADMTDCFPHGTAVIAETQASGKGRLGRAWSSPRGGVFLSLILRPPLSPARVPALALAVGYSISLVLRDLFALDAKVKWPNDILIGGRKACGILCEMKAEIDAVSWVIAGIGVNANLTPMDLSVDVRSTATSLQAELGRNVDRNRLIASILNCMEPIYEDFVAHGLSNMKGSISAILSHLNQPVIVKNASVVGSPDLPGIARGIDNEGRLLLETAHGETRTISAGDLSLRSQSTRL
ncbi:MAG: biotin--[acetyl-CoA-carboxylase] ligase [Bacillota bacterium]